MATRSKRKLVDQNEDQQTSQLNDNIYHLEWAKRSELITLLFSYSSFILCESNHSKEELEKMNINLYRNLTSLPLKSTVKKSRKSNVPNELAQNRPILELDYDTKSKIINCLGDNQNWTFTSDDCLANDVKLNLINQNNELICALTKLPFKMIEMESNSCDLESNGSSLLTNGKFLF